VSQKSKKDARSVVNVPASGTAERVYTEKDLGGGSVLRLGMLEEALTFSGALAATFTGTIPANSRIQQAGLNNDTALTLAGNAAKIGLGTAADPDAFALSDGTATKNAKTNAQPVEATAIVATAVRPVISACVTNGSAAAGTNTATGTCRGRLIFTYATSIADAP
jgi:hypothetical protein